LGRQSGRAAIFLGNWALTKLSSGLSIALPRDVARARHLAGPRYKRLVTNDLVEMK